MYLYQCLTNLKNQKSNLESELFQAKVTNPILTKEQLLFAFSNLRKIDISTQEGKQRLIDTFVNSIYLYDDYFVITFNYKGQAKTVTFEQLNSSPLTSKGSPNEGDKNTPREKPNFRFLFLLYCFRFCRRCRRGNRENQVQ